MEEQEKADVGMCGGEGEGEGGRERREKVNRCSARGEDVEDEGEVGQRVREYRAEVCIGDDGGGVRGKGSEEIGEGGNEEESEASRWV